VSVLCLFVDNLDPSNTKNGLQFVGFQRSSSSRFSSLRFMIPLDLVGLRP
jgi:hypothetical protein